jgi:hypothetical protein
MSFFDSKEEVINLELTSYGKFLLSKGLLKPVYYSFHDDDIIYDSNYAGFSEDAGSSEVRIQEETLYVKTLYSFKSPKPFLDKAINQENYLGSINNQNEYKVDYFDNSLGESSIYNLNVPSWQIINLSSEFVTTSETFGDTNLRIPQFECVLTASFIKTTQDKVDEDNELAELLSTKFETLYLNDGTIHFSDLQELVIKIEELNTDADFDKFDLEIFKVSTNNDGVESYEIMKLPKPLNYVDDNGLLQNLSSLNIEENYDDSYANRFLEVLVDKEIPDEIACKHILTSPVNQDSIFNDISICDNVLTKYKTNELYKILNDRATGRNC